MVDEKKYRFERLTPTDNIDLNVYEDAINFVFENPDVKNVAISGAYSAGKSSVLASYKKNHKDLHFLHISLAHFRSPEEDNNDEVKESILEGKILNQLIHQIPSNKILQSNFRVKKKVNTRNIIQTTALLMIFLITVLFLSFFDLWRNYISSMPKNWFRSLLAPSVSPYAPLIGGVILVLTLSISLYNVIRLQKNKNIFRKLNFQGNEIEIFEESNESYFDKYLNEVLYLFENVEKDVVVFEDMDRFNANQIFERLREVNTLVNIQREKPLRFFYLLRDDIFVSKDRTKFFDYIMPVVPVLDSSNSYNQFISHLEQSGLLKKFDENFLQGLSLYIDDMRLLKNIYNEFLIYYNRLNITELNYNKMLAIMAYKNLFPRDFSDLQLNQGFVHTLFDKKDDFILKEKNYIEQNISDKKLEIEQIKNEHLLSSKELDIVYDERKAVDYYSRKLPLDEKDQAEYIARKKKLEIKLSNKLPMLEAELYALEQEMFSIQNRKLNELITRKNIDYIFSVTSINEIGHETSFDVIKSSEYFDLLKYLIWNGYIDETYADYMTYFYENSLSRIDKIFLRSITDKRAKEYTYRLNNPELVISHLRMVDCDQQEILNFDLLEYMLKTRSPFEYLEGFISQLREKKMFGFVSAYYNTSVELIAFVRQLNIQWPEMWITARETNSLSEKQLRKYSIDTIYYSEGTDIQAVNKDDVLRQYISDSSDYLSIYEPDVQKLIDGFKLLKVCFHQLDYENSDKVLFEAVYKNSLYEINFKNIKHILQYVIGIENEADIHHKNYTLILNYKGSHLAQFILRNINKYMSIMLDASEGEISDSEYAALSILNNTEISIEHKRTYVETVPAPIISIKTVEDNSLWKLLLNVRMVSYSEENIMDYFCIFNLLDDALISFINSTPSDLDFSKIKLTYEDKNLEDLFDAAIICNSLKNEKYKQILASLNIQFENFNIQNISDKKMEILIDSNIITMNAETLIFIRENYTGWIFHFILKNIDDYVKIMTAELFVKSELKEILSWNIADELKIKTLKMTNEKFSVINKKYSPDVTEHILQYNFMDSDRSDLFASFEQWNEPIQHIILNIAADNVSSIIDNSEGISYQLLIKLLHLQTLSRDLKIELLIAILSWLDERAIKEALSTLELANYIKIFDIRSRPKFPIDTTSEKLLTAFKKNHWINSYEEDTEGKNYKVVRKKPSKPLSTTLL